VLVRYTLVPQWSKYLVPLGPWGELGGGGGGGIDRKAPI